MTELTVDNLQKIESEALAALEGATSVDALEQWRVTYIGRKGQLPQLLRQLKELAEDDRRVIGPQANALRQQLEGAYDDKEQALSAKDVFSERAAKVTGRAPLPPGPGHKHLISEAMRRLYQIFAAMGFEIVVGPEVEEEKYNFDYLNIDFEHPARAESDTFYLKNIEETVLRTHVSNLQVRAVVEHDLTPPFKFMYYGRCFRAEKPDPSHESTFHQFEYMMVDEQASLADIKGIAKTAYSTFFGREVDIRFRPAYFPFVEPGFEVDISCVFCGGKGCRVCKQSGWIELAGAGSVHPNVLRNMNVDPDTYQGIAMGSAVDRLVMLQNGINDIRELWSGDIRFLKQFGS